VTWKCENEFVKSTNDLLFTNNLKQFYYEKEIDKSGIIHVVAGS
jgi:hypothetical protein